MRSVHSLLTLLTQITVTFVKVPHLSAIDFLKYGPPPPAPSAEEIKTALIKHEIFKDLGINKYPKYALQVNYEANHLTLGTKVPDYLAILPPDGVNFTHFDYDGYYALIVVGLDCPTREKPRRRSFEHWVLGNIPENQFLNAESLVPYEWREAPYKKGLHRVVFLLYKQPEKTIMVYDERYMMRSNITLPRSYFNTTFFAVKYRLGDPVAVNFFITDIDENHEHETETEWKHETWEG